MSTPCSLCNIKFLMLLVLANRTEMMIATPRAKTMIDVLLNFLMYQPIRHIPQMTPKPAKMLSPIV